MRTAAKVCEGGGGGGGGGCRLNCSLGSVDSVPGVLSVWAVDAPDELEAPSDLIRKIRLAGHERVTCTTGAAQVEPWMRMREATSCSSAVAHRYIEGLMLVAWRQSFRDDVREQAEKQVVHER